VVSGAAATVARALDGRRLLFPVTERTFTYERYVRLLDALADRQRFRVVPLREYTGTRDSARAVVALRHDVDQRLDRAFDFARLEHERGLPATYFVLNTASYWRDPQLIPTLVRMQDELGHEIGWHNDLVTWECVLGGDARACLAEELARLRSVGLRVEGTAAHGSPSCYRYGYHNGYFFFPDEPADGFPNREAVDGPLGRREIPHGRLEEFGLRYDAYHLDNSLYFSDASFDASGRRWHTDQLDLRVLEPGSRTIILTHPDHWDRSMGAKLTRFAWKVRAELRGDG
jgi:hypothetical protein